MRRRDFLNQAAIGTAAATTVGCGASLPHTAAPALPPMTDARGRELAGLLDETLAGLEHVSLIGGELPRGARRHHAVRRYVDHADPMAKRAVQSLVVAAVAKEVPAGTEAPAPLRDAIERRFPLLDHHVVETAAFFERMPLQDRRRLARHLRDDSDLPARMADRIERLGRSAGVGETSLRAVHDAARTVRFRLTKQPPSVFLDEQVAKVRRVAAHQGAEAHLSRAMATHASTAALLTSLQQVGPGIGSGLAAPTAQPAETDSVPLPPPGLPEVGGDPEDPSQIDAAPDNHRRGVIPAAIGGMMLGTGAILLGISIPLTVATGGIEWMVGITGGVIVAVGGLILLIVGGALMASR